MFLVLVFFIGNVRIFLLFLSETIYLDPEVLREKLKKATRAKDAVGLFGLIEEVEAAALPELGSDLRKARDALEKLGGGRGG